MKANILSGLAIVIGTVLLGICYAHEPWTPLRTAGAVIGLPSLLLLLVARIELGGAFSGPCVTSALAFGRTFTLGYVTPSMSLGR